MTDEIDKKAINAFDPENTPAADDLLYLRKGGGSNVDRKVPHGELLNSRGFAQSVDSVEALRASSFPESLERVWLSGYYGVGTAGGGPLYIDRDDTASADNGGTVFVTADGVRVKRPEQTFYTPEQFGAKGDGTDDITAINNALSITKKVQLVSRYAVSDTVKANKINTTLVGLGPDTGFDWIGGNGATAPDKTGGKTVLQVHRDISDGTYSAITGCRVGFFEIDLQGANNIVGAAFIYFSRRSSASDVLVFNGGDNCIGVYYSKLWYASFDNMAARNFGDGSDGHYLSSYWSQINEIPFRGMQASSCRDGLVIDTTDGYQYANDISITAENCVNGVHHLSGGIGVRIGLFPTCYFESNSGYDILWGGAGSDSTGSIRWVSAQFDSPVRIEEGNHFVEGIGLSEIEVDGAQTRVRTTASNPTATVTNGANYLSKRFYTSFSFAPNNDADTPRPMPSISNRVNSASDSELMLTSAEVSNMNFGGTAGLGRSIMLEVFVRRSYETFGGYEKGLITGESGDWAYETITTVGSSLSVSVDTESGAVTVEYTLSGTKVIELVATAI